MFLFGEETMIEVSEKNTEKNKASEENPEWSLPVIEAEEKNRQFCFLPRIPVMTEEIKEYLKSFKGRNRFALTEVNVAEGENIRLFKELLKTFGRNQDDGKVRLFLQRSGAARKG